jgi:hypothetical protein
VRHARGDDFLRLQPMLEQIRALDGVVEKSEGSFYRRSKGFLHFHIDGDDIYADLRLAANDPFTRMRATSKAEQRSLVAVARRAIASA